MTTYHNGKVEHEKEGEAAGVAQEAWKGTHIVCDRRGLLKKPFDMFPHQFLAILQVGAPRIA